MYTLKFLGTNYYKFYIQQSSITRIQLNRNIFIEGISIYLKLSLRKLKSSIASVTFTDVSLLDFFYKNLTR